MCRSCKQLRPYRSCPYRGASGRRSQVAPNDKQVGVGACHSLDLTETLHQTWADFATGKEVLWPAYDTDTRQIMSYAHNNHDSAHQVVQDPRGSERKWWDGHPATTWPAKPNQRPHLTSSAAEDAVTNRSECGKSLCALVSNV
ncbi:hypothetical protein [Streptomyces mirabilis]